MNNGNTRTKFEICSKLIWKTEVVSVVSKQIPHNVFVFPLFTLNTSNIGWVKVMQKVPEMFYHTDSMVILATLHIN